MSTSGYPTLIFLIGRLLVGGMFLQSGISNMMGSRAATAGYAASKGLMAADAMVLLASALLVVAGVCLVTGFHPWVGIIAITVFLIPVTVTMHNFWAYDGLTREIELHSFSGNVGLLGSALMFLAIPQPWPLSVDAWIAARRQSPILATNVGSPVASATLAQSDQAVQA